MNIKLLWFLLPLKIWAFIKLPDKRPLPLFPDEVRSRPEAEPRLELKNDKKIGELARMARLEKNILPVSLLSLISGMSVCPHNWKEWIHSPPFLAATSMLYLMASASMIINDIQDFEVDLINNPKRPLVAGTVTVQEATITAFVMFSLYTYLGIQFLPPILDPIWSLAMILISIYTPVLKKICFIKNLTCSSIVALSVPFVGWSVINPLATTLPDFHWLLLTTRIVFTASLFIEMMLDVTDIVGDRASGISTIPVVVGEPITMGILTGILGSSQWVSLTEARDITEIVIILVTYLPLYYHIYKVYKYKYQKNTVMNAIKQTTIQLGLYLYMMILKQ